MISLEQKRLHGLAVVELMHESRPQHKHGGSARMKLDMNRTKQKMKKYGKKGGHEIKCRRNFMK